MSTSPWEQRFESLMGMTRPEVGLSVCADPKAERDLADAQQRLQDLLHAAAANTPAGQFGVQPVDTDEITQAREGVHKAGSRVRDAQVHFLFRGLESKDYDALVSAHPPRPDQDGMAVDPDTFIPVLVAASHVHIEIDDDGNRTEHDGMTVDQAERLLTRLSAGERERLVIAARAVNQESRIDFEALGKGSGPTGG
jgi:hypothetical protein